MGEHSIHRGQCGWSKVSKGTMGVELTEGRIGGEYAGHCRLIRILAFTLGGTRLLFDQTVFISRQPDLAVQESRKCRF